METMIAELIQKSGLSKEQVAGALGCSVSAINKYCSGELTPCLKTLLEAADFFAVPLDYLCGRCTEQQANEILKNYSGNFRKLQHAAYEKYLITDTQPDIILASRWKAPWPYNLVDEVLGEPADFLLSDDHIAAINVSLESLPDRERSVILRYYQDGKTLQEIGDEQSVSRTRIQQIRDKGVLMLRHPHTVKMFRYGLAVTHTMETLEEKQSEVKQAEERLEFLMYNLSELDKEIRKRKAEVERLKALTPSLDNEIASFGLSVRSYNCLMRAKCKTLRDVVNLAQQGKLPTIRCMGKKSVKEVVEMIRVQTGRNYSVENGL